MDELVTELRQLRRTGATIHQEVAEVLWTLDLAATELSTDKIAQVLDKTRSEVRANLNVAALRLGVRGTTATIHAARRTGMLNPSPLDTPGTGNQAS